MNHHKPTSTQFPVGVPVIGQPFTLNSLSIPVNAELRCNCSGGTLVSTVMSAPAACESCGREFAATFNPQTGQLQFHIKQPETKVIQ